ncbi:hypothetical protein P700755_001155 [Psychroflexus torquis ATCC 700755]|uniref:Uncharacterized protein n=1 Tax=Psychroflexus torquis (strain ATCC 700755 / CIP 106069 / ACAM 623) TaxID=313595 RepID=K4IGC6_PSYTT|nr:hypothetical protein P700755_001155 [Psychroflexus torquis ATCC 700755]
METTSGNKNEWQQCIKIIRAFVLNRKSMSFNKVHQIVDLAFIKEQIKNKIQRFG